ncbi:hypothetical protein D9758_012329 [Tetrapyrgos nigripes]|uniref:Polysaccharide lyase 14 domain-containing protein n=1 Tax=Tetrapyrgos nigripes TaxID=182062 RepID=A0A8H5CNT1_9AGAR|nr:hypothetical protein D9758_012329 [Tetrapyrgos nigripes]
MVLATSSHLLSSLSLSLRTLVVLFIFLTQDHQTQAAPLLTQPQADNMQKQDGGSHALLELFSGRSVSLKMSTPFLLVRIDAVADQLGSSSATSSPLNVNVVPVVVRTGTIWVTQGVQSPAASSTIVPKPPMSVTNAKKTTATTSSTHAQPVHTIIQTHTATYTATATRLVKVITEMDTLTFTATQTEHLTEHLKIITDTDVLSTQTQMQTGTQTLMTTTVITQDTPNPTYWSMPAQITDLDAAFGIKVFPGPRSNIELVDSIPESASAASGSASSATSSSAATSTSASATSSPDPALQAREIELSIPVLTVPLPFLEPFQIPHQFETVEGDDEESQTQSGSMLQVYYPEGSINPAGSPKGGSQFYASPLDLSSAQSVSLSYSVFFPADFDFVLGGKLPGLYGGRTGCSGGDDAEDCFSTRMMWRKGGAGELYLYAPKQAQTSSLCEDPHSVCDSDYGLSVGRGSFVFKRGGWTNINQTVVLNTPGEQDGKFTLYVDGQKVLEREDILYRNKPSPGGSGDNDDERKGGKGDAGDDKGKGGEGTGGNNSAPSDKPTLKPKPKPVPSPSIPAHIPSIPVAGNPGQGGLGGLLGGLGSILGGGSASGGSSGLLGGILRREDNSFGLRVVPANEKQNQWVWNLGVEVVPEAELEQVELVEGLEEMQEVEVVDDLLDAESSDVPMEEASSQSDMFGIEEDDGGQTIGFQGIFFSTFFGGHEEEYATPKDQYVWFKEFELSVHE